MREEIKVIDLGVALTEQQKTDITDHWMEQFGLTEDNQGENDD